MDYFKTKLAEQLGCLERSCNAFDAGHHYEVLQIATRLRVLFHQTKNSRSLLHHLNATEINMLSTTLDIVAKMNDPWLKGGRLTLFNGMGHLFARLKSTIFAEARKLIHSETRPGCELVERNRIRIGRQHALDPKGSCSYRRRQGRRCSCGRDIDAFI